MNYMKFIFICILLQFLIAHQVYLQGGSYMLFNMIDSLTMYHNRQVSLSILLGYVQMYIDNSYRN